MLVVFLSPSSRGLLTWLVKCIHSIDFPFSFSILGEKIGFSYLSFLSKIPRDVVLPKPKAPAKLIYYKSSRCSFFQKKPIPYIEERMLNFKYIRRNRACWIQKYLCFLKLSIKTLSQTISKNVAWTEIEICYINWYVPLQSFWWLPLFWAANIAIGWHLNIIKRQNLHFYFICRVASKNSNPQYAAKNLYQFNDNLSWGRKEHV